MYGNFSSRNLNSIKQYAYNMPKLPIRKPKRVSVLTKRAQCLRKHYKKRSYRPLYEKLKNNNTYLAKALSKEKQNSQSLFTENVQLIGEIQQLNLVCNTRNTVISNVLNNAKEILRMLVTMTGYMTNTISMCQELVTSNTAMRFSSASTGKKESSNRLSTKSPAKGVVKPMVSGHTITKPTINLSRVNIESINNISRLSDIQEVTTPNRSQEMSEIRSPIISLTPLRYENGSSCRLSERLTISSPRIGPPEQQRLRKKRNHSKRLSVSFSRSQNRWSEIDETPTSAGHINIIGTRINIGNQENDNTPHDLSDRLNTTSESQAAIDSNDEDITRVNLLKTNPDVQIGSKVPDKDVSRNSDVMGNSRLSQNNTRTWEDEDPLEGPSWLFNNTMPLRDNEPEELDHSDVNNNTSQVIMYDDASVTESNVEDVSNLNESMSDMQTSDKDAAHIAENAECESYLHEQNVDDICEILPATVSNREESLDNIDDSNVDDSMNFDSFVTLRRGSSEVPEETEDFTLMLRESRQNMQFNINELRLPVLEKPMINDSRIHNAIDTEVTTAIPRVTNIPVASVSSRSLNESDYNHITIKLPLILINDHKRMLTPQRKHSNKSNKKPKRSNTEDHENSLVIKNIAKSKKSENSRDPSAAKVVLEKLNQSHVKPKISSADGQNTSNVMRDTTSDEEENLRDSESNTYASSRPRRRKAPVNLKEPKLNKKLRREN